MSALPPIGAIAPQQISSLFPTDEVAPQRAGAANGASAFGTMVSQGLAQVNEKLLASQTDLQALATGETQNVHQVMIQLEESRLSFQLMMQVRGRLLEAYQDIMKMQI
jgi:flagellar hook-basal body complex protein FliE